MTNKKHNMPMTQKDFDFLKSQMEELINKRITMLGSYEGIKSREFTTTSADRDNELTRINGQIAALRRRMEAATIVEEIEVKEGAVKPDDVIDIALIINGTKMSQTVKLVTILDDTSTMSEDNIPRITISSPLGQAILGAEAGETRNYVCQMGQAQVEILEIKEKAKGRN